MERRKFTREFKLEAVRLIKERGVSYAQASLDLGVHQSQLRSWVKAPAGDPQQGRAWQSARTRVGKRGLWVAKKIRPCPITQGMHSGVCGEPSRQRTVFSGIV